MRSVALGKLLGATATATVVRGAGTSAAALTTRSVGATVLAARMSTAASPPPNKLPITAQDFASSDAELQASEAFKKAFAKYSAPASEERLNKTVEAMKAKGYDVRVVGDEKAAVQAIGSYIKDGMSYSSGGSTTLTEIDFGKYLAERDAKINNLKGKSIAAAKQGDTAKQQSLLAQGANADVFVSSCSALTTSGNIFSADASGSRHYGFFTAGKLIIVAGTNKIVDSDADAHDRLWNYQLPLESARVRVAFKIKGSAVNNEVALRGANPFSKDVRIVVVLVKKALGF